MAGPAKNSPKSARRAPVQVTLELPDDARVKGAPLAVYAFSQGGSLLDVTALDAGASAAVVHVPLGAEGTSARILVGPVMDENVRDLAELMRRGAIERHLRVDLDAKELRLHVPIDIDKILCWLRGLYFVKGTVLKRATLGGQHIDLPVCDATVEIYEVDPFFIILPKLPPYVLQKLRDVILHPIPLPDPPPELEPGPFPGAFGPQVERLDVVARKAGSATADAAHSHADAAIALSTVESASGLRLAAATGSDLVFGQSLIAHERLIRPLFCALFPYWFTMQRVGTAHTDDCGHFRTFFFNGCNNHDAPDLYFKVTQRFFGLFDIVVYGPKPVPCHTWWNYVSGTEVTLVSTHPLARTCSPCGPVIAGDNWVVFKAIGGTSLNSIHGSSATHGASTTPSNRGLTIGGAPFGGTLRPQIDFDNSLREHLGVKYYKLSHRRVGDPTWIPMTAEVTRHYTSGNPPIGNLYKLGPLTATEAPVAGLYEIPPALPPAGIWTPTTLFDIQNGAFDSTLAAPGITYDRPTGAEVGTDTSGMFEVMLELFDTAGAPVDIVARGIRYFVPNVDDLTGTITTVEAAPLGLVVGNQMIVTLHVDNNPTFAEIGAPAIGGATADPCCGVLAYGPGAMVTLPWKAAHPNGFATYGFVTKRVDAVVYDSGSQPVGAGADHSTVQSAQALMDTNLPVTCTAGGCTVAAFASYESTTAMATDGWSRLSYLDDADFEAFCLQQAVIPPGN
jgi:hypothetical protein